MYEVGTATGVLYGLYNLIMLYYLQVLNFALDGETSRAEKQSLAAVYLN